MSGCVEKPSPNSNTHAQWNKKTNIIFTPLQYEAKEQYIVESDIIPLFKDVEKYFIHNS